MKVYLILFLIPQIIGVQISEDCLYGITSANICCQQIRDRVDVFLRNPHDCNKYYHCLSEMAIQMNCPFGYHWSVENKVCVLPKLAGCKRDGVDKKIGGGKKNRFDMSKEEREEQKFNEGVEWLGMQLVGLGRGMKKKKLERMKRRRSGFEGEMGERSDFEKRRESRTKSKMKKQKRNQINTTKLNNQSRRKKNFRLENKNLEDDPNNTNQFTSNLNEGEHRKINKKDKSELIVEERPVLKRNKIPDLKPQKRFSKRTRNVEDNPIVNVKKESVSNSKESLVIKTKPLKSKKISVLPTKKGSNLKGAQPLVLQTKQRSDFEANERLVKTPKEKPVMNSKQGSGSKTTISSVMKKKKDLKTKKRSNMETKDRSLEAKERSVLDSVERSILNQKERSKMDGTSKLVKKDKNNRRIYELSSKFENLPKIVESVEGTWVNKKRMIEKTDEVVEKSIKIKPVRGNTSMEGENRRKTIRKPDGVKEKKVVVMKETTEGNGNKINEKGEDGRGTTKKSMNSKILLQKHKRGKIIPDWLTPRKTTKSGSTTSSRTTSQTTSKITSPTDFTASDDCFSENVRSLRCVFPFTHF